MKLRAELATDSYLLDLTLAPARAANTAAELAYSLAGENREEERGRETGRVSISEVMPGVFSLLEGTRSTVVTLWKAPGGGVVASVRGKQLQVALADVRDRAPRRKDASVMGPLEVRAMMPGKVVRVLVSKDDDVTAGQGVMIVEAMKMQNELKAPKTGRVTKVYAEAGSAVTAGAALLVIE